MKILFVFDHQFDINTFFSSLENDFQEIVLFPLTSNRSVLDTVINGCKSSGQYTTRILNSASLINDEVELLRHPLRNWSFEVGKWKIGSRNIIDWLVLPKCGISSWWLGLLSEKNTLKTEAFFQMAQINAVRKILSSEKFDLCVLALTEKSVCDALRVVAEEFRVSQRIIQAPRPASFGSRKKQLKALIEHSGILGHLLIGFYTWLYFIVCSYTAKMRLPAVEKRLPNSNPLLFISYFPAIDEKAAQKGIFLNNYAPVLHELLSEKEIPVTWLLIPVFINQYGFTDAVRIAGSFSSRGERLFILHEFLTFHVAMKGLYLWLRQCFLGLYLFRSLKKTGLFSSSIGPEFRPTVRSLWETSFQGAAGMEGILFVLIFKEVFRRIKNVTDCIYYCEMHAWEKALNAAKAQIVPSVRTIGYQHTSISRNYFHYFYDEAETRRTGLVTDMPLPDVLACNSELMCSLLAEAGYPNLTHVEALRFLYLSEILSTPASKPDGRPVLLVAGSVDRKEMIALISLIYSTFPVSDTCEIWLKGHPSLPIERIFDELQIDLPSTGYKVQNGKIADCLQSASAVIVGSSAVSVEALAFGCEVIIPVFPETMLMSPLSDFEQYFHQITSAKELKEVMEQIPVRPILESLSRGREFIREYWDLNVLLPKWSELLGLDEVTHLQVKK